MLEKVVVKYFFNVLSMNLNKRKGSTDCSSMYHWTDVEWTHREPFNFVEIVRRSLKGVPFGYLSFIPGVMQTDMLTESQKSKFPNTGSRRSLPDRICRPSSGVHLRPLRRNMKKILFK